MPFPDLPPERIPGSPGHLNDHQLIDQALDYIQQSGYRDDPNFPPLPDVPVLGESGHVTAHDRILAVLEYVKAKGVGTPPGIVSTFITSGTYAVPDAVTSVRVVIVGGGADGGAGPEGKGGEVVDRIVACDPGEKISVTVGAANAASKVVGSFGSITAAPGAQPNATYVSGFGWYSGSGQGQASNFISDSVGCGQSLQGTVPNLTPGPVYANSGGGGASRGKGASGFVAFVTQ